MIASHRSFIHVLGSVLVYSSSGLSFSAAAQDEAPTPVLIPQEFAAVAIPDEFDVLEHITWGARALVNHSNLKEIVPVFGYRSSDVCSRDNGEFVSNLPDPKPGALLLDVEQSKSGRAVWFDSLEDVCSPSENGSSNHISWNIADDRNAKPWEIAAAEIGNDLLTDLNQSVDENGQPKHFILTIGHLPDVTEAGSYWWICNIKDPLTANNSACYDTLSASPYIQHRDLL